MALVLIHGVRRPTLAAPLAARGLVPVEDAGAAALALVPCLSVAPTLPRVVQTTDGDAAAALLDQGADDVVLADDPDALVAARLALLARAARGRTIVMGDIRIDPVERQVSRAGRPIPLLPREYRLLLLLARARGRTVASETIRHALSGNACSPGTNVVAVHLSRLRTRLGVGTALIVTDRRGYRLVAEAEPDG